MKTTKIGNQDPKQALLPCLHPFGFGHQQNVDQLVERRVGFLLDLVELHRPDGMLCDQHRVVRRAEGFFFRLRQRGKCVGDESDGKLTALLNLQ